MPIKINSVIITDEQVHEEMQYHTAAHVGEAMFQAAQALTIRELLRQAANISLEDMNTPLGEQKVYQHLLTVLPLPEPDTKTCENYYHQQVNKFVSPTGETIAFEDVRESIADYLRDHAWQVSVKQYVQQLIGEADLTGIRLTGAESPLMNRF